MKEKQKNGNVFHYKLMILSIGISKYDEQKLI